MLNEIKNYDVNFFFEDSKLVISSKNKSTATTSVLKNVLVERETEAVLPMKVKSAPMEETFKTPQFHIYSKGVDERRMSVGNDVKAQEKKEMCRIEFKVNELHSSLSMYHKKTIRFHELSGDTAKDTIIKEATARFMHLDTNIVSDEQKEKTLQFFNEYVLSTPKPMELPIELSREELQTKLRNQIKNIPEKPKIDPNQKHPPQPLSMPQTPSNDQVENVLFEPVRLNSNDQVENVLFEPVRLNSFVNPPKPKKGLVQKIREIFNIKKK